jgi:hypothetical protein
VPETQKHDFGISWQVWHPIDDEWKRRIAERIVLNQP